MNTRTSAAQYAAALLLLVAAGTHVPLIPEHLEEAPYVGVLFTLLTLACVALAAAVVLLTGSETVWTLSGAVCLAAVVAYLGSRTVGLPQLHDDIGNWTEPLSFPAVAAEALMVALAAARLRSRPPART